MEKEFNYKDSLQVIEGMIAQAKYRPGKTDGIITLMWGYLVMTAALLHWFLQVVMKVDYAPAAWFLMLVGAVATGVFKRKAEREKRVKTYVDTLIAQVWLAFVISFGVLFFAMQPTHVNFLPTVMLLYGGGMWVHGSLIKFKPYRAGAVACWLGSALAFFLVPEHQLLVLAGAVVFGYIVPGHLLYAKTSQSDV
ncbi:MAG: hypothetical protein R2788_02000 [Saprospiraceae bacterium]